MKIQNNGLARYAGGQRYEPDEEGFVDIPDDIAKAEGLGKTKAEATEEEDPELAELVDKATVAGVADKEGKKVPPSVLKKWAKPRLVDAIAKAEADAKAKADAEEKK